MSQGPCVDGARSPFPAWRTGAGLLLLALTAAGCEFKPPPVETTTPVVQVALPVVRQVTDYQIFTARTEAVQSVNIKPRVTGYLTKINFKDGDMVKENQVLFELDDRPYKAALDEALGQVEFQKAAVVKTKADYDIGMETYKLNPGAISKQELSKRLGAWDEAKGSLAAAEGALEKAQLNFGWCKVTAPVAGRTDRHFVDVGNLVMQDNTTLTNIVSLKPMWAYFDVDQNTVVRMERLLQEKKIPSPREKQVPVAMALGNSGDYSYQGVIDFVANQLDPNTGSIRVRVVFPNEDSQLISGMFCRVKAPVSAAHQALLVNDRAIGTDQGQRFLLVVNDKDEVEYRRVEVGLLHEGLREVLPTINRIDVDAKGQKLVNPVEVLKATDRIIVIGLQRVRPGMKAKPEQVDMQTLLKSP